MEITKLIDKSPGIYSIVNMVNGKFYVGSTISLIKRSQQHLNQLRKNRHHSQKLQAAFNKYGEENFVFDLIESVSDKSLLINREQVWVDFMNPEYNMNKLMVNSPLGRKFTEAIKIKMRGKTPWNKGKNSSPETIKKLIESHKGYKHTEEQKRKISESNMGRIATKTTRKKLSIAMTQNHPSHRCILNLQTGIFYNGLKRAYDSLGENISLKVFIGKLSKRTCDFVSVDEIKQRNKYLYKTSPKNAISILNINTGIFYDSIIAAEKSYGIGKKICHFSDQILGKRKNNTPFIIADETKNEKAKIEEAKLPFKDGRAAIILNAQNGIFYSTIKEAHSVYGKGTITQFFNRMTGLTKNDTNFINTNLN